MTDDLSFDSAIPNAEGESKAGAVHCSLCRRPVTTEYFTANGAPLCASCRAAYEAAAAPVRQPAMLAKAALFGFGATVVGAVIYYAVMRYLNLEIGLVAILTGWMVGKAMIAATKGRGGLMLQLGAAALTYISVAMAYFPFAMQHALAAGTRSDSSAVATSAGVGTDSAPSREMIEPDREVSVTPAETGNKLGGIRTLIALAAVALFALALPVLLMVGSMPSGLISAAIIGFGMFQAWQLTAAPKFVFEGPFRVGGSASGGGGGAG